MADSLDSNGIDTYRERALLALKSANDETALSGWHQAHLGRQGELSRLKKSIGQVAAEIRKDYGQAINGAANILEEAFQVQQGKVEQARLLDRLKEQTLDVTLPARAQAHGTLHPLTLMLREVVGVFSSLGFSVFESPHVESDENNFQHLNMPPDHPARDMQDTFFVSSDVVMRTHTSPGQIRAMKQYASAPLRIIVPGLCYRYEDVNPRKDIQFHQVEGLMIGPSIRLSDLKGLLLTFARRIFGPDQVIRMRGSYFPFTEPSVEVDIRCTLCKGTGCRVCKMSGWLELLGAGLVHPSVLRAGGYNPEEVQGIAFGMGIARILLLRHRIEDIRYLFQNDLRFLEQFT